MALSALELLHVRRALRDDGVFRWPTLRRDFAGAPLLLRRALDALLSYRSFVALLVAQLVAGLLGVLVEQPALSSFLLIGSLLVSVRFRGSYNGGSDAMLLVVLIGVSGARLFESELLRTMAFAYIAAQLVLSYFVAGVAKLREPSWRAGHALHALLQLAPYGAPPLSLRLASHPRLAALGAWSVIALECAAPLALVDILACTLFASLALAFHLANVALLGLNRFFWAWLAAYPALFYFSQR